MVDKNLKSQISNLKSHGGAALVVTTGIMLIVAILVGAILFLKISELAQARVFLRQLEASYIAQAGVEHAIYWLRMYKAPVWEWGDPEYIPSTTYSGTKCWGTRLQENYRNNLTTAFGIERLVTQEIATGATANLRFFFQWRRGNAGDVAIVRESTNGGITWTTLTTLNTSSSWVSSGNLALSPNSNVMIAFEINTDSNLTAPGLYIDDVCVSSGAGCTGTINFFDNCEDGVGKWWHQIVLGPGDPANFPQGSESQFYNTIDSTFATTDTWIIRAVGKKEGVTSNAEAKIQLSGETPPYLVNILYYKRGL